MTIIGPLPAPGPGPINTLNNAWLEWSAAWNILGGREPWFVGVPWAEYLRGIHRSGQAWLPPSLLAAHDAGQFFLTLEVATRLALPAQGNLLEQAFDRTPAALRGDSQADWRQWPMRVKPDWTLGR